MNLDHELRQSLDANANAVTPRRPPTSELIDRAQRRRWRMTATASVAGAVAVVLIAGIVATRPSEAPTSAVASGKGGTATTRVEGGAVGGSPAATTSTTRPRTRPTTSVSSPSASTIYPRQTTSTAPPNTTSTTTPNPAGDVIVNQDDAGKTFTLQRGQRLIVNLSTDGWDYSEPASDNDAVVHRVSGHADPSGAATATFRADAVGQAQVSSSRDAKCRKSSPPCMTPTFLFQVTVNVV